MVIGYTEQKLFKISLVELSKIIEYKIQSFYEDSLPVDEDKNKTLVNLI